MKDLTGMTFGRWKVLHYRGNGRYLCECQCSNHTIKEVNSRDLESGGSMSCGCIKREKSDITGNTYGDIVVTKYIPELYEYEYKCKCGYIGYRRKADILNSKCKCNHTKKGRLRKEDITGKQFGNWVVLEYVGNYKWKCQCQCINKTIRIISRYDLEHGNTTNCGCMRHKDLSNKRFGRLIAKRYLGNMQWECECDCGNKVVILSANLINGGTKSCGYLKNESRNTREEYIEVINKFIQDNNELPFVEDIANIINIHKENARHNINKYSLNELINKSFGSRKEKQIYDFLCTLIDKECIINHEKGIINPLELDFYIDKYKLAIEFDGNYWHSTEKIGRLYHQNKTVECMKKHIQLIHIFEYEWDDDIKREKIKKLIENKICNKKEIIYARNTNIKYISQNECNEFLNKFHLQNAINSEIRLGLTYGDRIISVLLIGKSRFNGNFQYEIIRYCTDSSIGVIGGIDKLFSKFIKDYDPESIITYCDISKFLGNAFAKVGFSISKENMISEPNYVWINHTGDIRKRYDTQKSKLVKQGIGKESETEVEIMQKLGYMQIFDCGNLRLEWYKQI